MLDIKQKVDNNKHEAETFITKNKKKEELLTLMIFFLINVAKVIERLWVSIPLG